MLRHHAPFRDHGLALSAPASSAQATSSTFTEISLPGEILQLRGLGVAGGDELEVSGPVSRLHSPFGGGSRRGSLVTW